MGDETDSMDEKGSPLHVLSDAAQNEESSAQHPAKKAAREGGHCMPPLAYQLIMRLYIHSWDLLLNVHVLDSLIDALVDAVYILVCSKF